MNARSYWKQAQAEIPDDEPSSLSTRDVLKHSTSNDLMIVLEYQNNLSS